MKIEIETREYEFAHGKRPSGTGSWAFTFFGCSGGRRVITEFAPGMATYSVAKHWALTRAKELEASRVKVGS